MALPDTLKVVRGTTLVFSDTATYSPTANQPSGTDADIDLNGSGSGIATGGVAWQSAKMDFTANFDSLYAMVAYLEYFSAPTAGGNVDFYLGFSDSATAATNNPANLSGADAVYQGYGADTASGTEALPQLEFVGSLIVTADIDLQVAHVGSFVPKDRYGMLVVVNNSSVAVAATDAIESCVACIPLQHQIQD